MRKWRAHVETIKDTVYIILSMPHNKFIWIWINIWSMESPCGNPAAKDTLVAWPPEHLLLQRWGTRCSGGNNSWESIATRLCTASHSYILYSWSTMTCDPTSSPYEKFVANLTWQLEITSSHTTHKGLIWYIYEEPWSLAFWENCSGEYRIMPSMLVTVQRHVSAQYLNEWHLDDKWI